MGRSIPPLAVLPSGRRVRLTKCVDPSRPWQLFESGGLFVLVRARRGDSSRTEAFTADRVEPLLFDGPDAQALCRLLNTNLRKKVDRHASEEAGLQGSSD